MLVNRLHVLFTLALATAAGVSAQNVPTCVLNCSTTALTGSGCGSLTNFTCLCASTTFQSAAAACIKSSCDSADQATATQLEQAECGTKTTGGNSTTGSNSTSPSNASSSSPAPSKSSSAIAPVEQLPFVTVFIAIAGVALGGAFVL